ncbi:PREDICTED: NAC-alpha domain-containing protein 1 [Chrysochloris asiatica]|uniref:NAC-alpha domain-containing protein 1 n=1 Tax=Chrysochloris asiatica TaxID=185453 RepID=A0A9B0WEN8_CHRAS|nr:PREDICTED: NAC-alpha domain-containing protein 1 [Chrysochloris asiatica]
MPREAAHAEQLLPEAGGPGQRTDLSCDAAAADMPSGDQRERCAPQPVPKPLAVTFLPSKPGTRPQPEGASWDAGPGQAPSAWALPAEGRPEEASLPATLEPRVVMGEETCGPFLLPKAAPTELRDWAGGHADLNPPELCSQGDPSVPCPHADPDSYFTPPSTPLQATCVLPPGLGPWDSEAELLGSPPTSPSGSYITADGDSWASSPSSSLNMLAPVEGLELPSAWGFSPQGSVAEEWRPCAARPQGPSSSSSSLSADSSSSWSQEEQLFDLDFLTSDSMIPAALLPFQGSLIFQVDAVEVMLLPSPEQEAAEAKVPGPGQAPGDEGEDDSTSASFLQSLSDISITEGMDEAFAFRDDTSAASSNSDSASYAEADDERLYSGEPHAQPSALLEDGGCKVEERQESWTPSSGQEGPTLLVWKGEVADIMPAQQPHGEEGVLSGREAATPATSHTWLAEVGPPHSGEEETDPCLGQMEAARVTPVVLVEDGLALGQMAVASPLTLQEEVNATTAHKTAATETPQILQQEVSLTPCPDSLGMSETLHKEEVDPDLTSGQETVATATLVPLYEGCMLCHESVSMTTPLPLQRVAALPLDPGPTAMVTLQTLQKKAGCPLGTVPAAPMAALAEREVGVALGLMPTSEVVAVARPLAPEPAAEPVALEQAQEDGEGSTLDLELVVKAVTPWTLGRDGGVFSESVPARDEGQKAMGGPVEPEPMEGGGFQHTDDGTKELESQGSVSLCVGTHGAGKTLGSSSQEGGPELPASVASGVQLCSSPESPAGAAPGPDKDCPGEPRPATTPSAPFWQPETGVRGSPRAPHPSRGVRERAQEASSRPSHLSCQSPKPCAQDRFQQPNVSPPGVLTESAPAPAPCLCQGPGGDCRDHKPLGLPGLQLLSPDAQQVVEAISGNPGPPVPRQQVGHAPLLNPKAAPVGGPHAKDPAAGTCTPCQVPPGSRPRPPASPQGLPVPELQEDLDSLEEDSLLAPGSDSHADSSAPEMEQDPAAPRTARCPPQVPAVSSSDETITKAKQSRSEKKARKAMSKLGLRQIQGVTRVTIQKSKNILFVISKPDVFKSPASDTYVVFGEAKIEDLSQQVHKAAAEKFKVPAEPSAHTTESTPGLQAKPECPEEEEVKVDEAGLELRDIELVMAQASVSRAKAVQALRDNHSDIVNAIMELTM